MKNAVKLKKSDYTIIKIDAGYFNLLKYRANEGRKIIKDNRRAMALLKCIRHRLTVYEYELMKELLPTELTN